MKNLLLLFLIPAVLRAQPFLPAEVSRWEKQAKQVRIIRDNYGIPHIYGRTDADAVFGLLYAQCEDDFRRVEMNYIEKLGRMAEVKGESELYNDLLVRLVIDQEAAKRDFTKAPGWLKKLCTAFADAVNYYRWKHPDRKPALLNRFEPWFPLLWTDGSIGVISTADITVNELRNFYSGEPPVAITRKTADPESDLKMTGSNGFAFSPKITESGNAILYINPHVTFYFRPEVHMTSEEGLNAYGAVTWGQFFIYQGFNEHCGWMHTSSGVDAADAYIEKISKRGTGWNYLYNGKQKPVREQRIVLNYTKGTTLETKTIRALFTHHGPIMASRDNQWLSVRADNRLLNGLVQCWQRTKATGLADFRKTLELKGNISNNTVYADAEGNIAYWHGNRIPVRDPKYDWSKAVDGSISSTEWKGYHSVEETVHCINPANGWLQNCNSTPFTVAGENSPRKESYPAYMAPDVENFRGINAVRVLSETSRYNMDKVIRAGYDTRLPAFELLVPALVNAFEKYVPYTDSFYAYLAGPVMVLKNWDYRCSENSVATTLAVEWGQKILPALLQTKVTGEEGAGPVEKARYYAAHASAHDLLTPLFAAINDLQSRFGRWQVPWGELNRFQRISTDTDNVFDDNKPSIPVGFVSSAWGMLPSYSSRVYPGTNKRYGVNGNSFVCAVEFGKRIKARSLLAGGESGDPASPHFSDQALMYSKGEFKEVLFYREDVLRHVERSYHPGE
ncbi:MAG: penicillin acylase family protein [Sphingobacteriales bacterium]|nr:penicillin acylase family protein [Sphingobacteriales bacterium]